jgi:hypothetical protein
MLVDISLKLVGRFVDEEDTVQDLAKKVGSSKFTFSIQEYS